jgi:hypothetical protein
METWVRRRPEVIGGTYGANDRVGGSMQAACVVLRLARDDVVEGVATVLSGRDTRIPLGYLQSIVARRRSKSA